MTVARARRGGQRSASALALAFALAAGGAGARAAATAPTPASPMPASATPVAAATARPPGHPAPGRRTPARKPAAATPARKPLHEAGDARALEEVGAYGQAAATLRALRAVVPPDADLELALALDEARSGATDSAAARLASPLLSAALVDTLPPARRHVYLWQREGLWVNGKFDGWSWYVARARAELGARRARWSEARDAARLAVAARPEAGKEWLVLAVCAGRAGDLEEAAHAAGRAVWLDPTLPEARYLAGLYAWRAGRRLEAQNDFRAAVALDSSYRAPAIALVRSRLPGTPPDSLPAELLTGVRAVGLLTSPARPKMEEFVQTDTQASILKQEILPLPDSLRGRFPKSTVYLGILVDERGRAVLHELPYSSPGALPEPMLRVVLSSMPDWRYQPATKSGRPVRAWANIQLELTP